MPHAQHRLDTKEDVQKRRKVPKVPKVPDFSPFSGKSLGAFRHFPNDNLSTFCTVIPPKGGGLFEGRHLVQFTA